MKHGKMHYHSTNYKREFNNDKFYNQIIGKVAKSMKRQLTKNEQSEVIAGIRKMDPDLFVPEYIDKTVNVMVKMLAKKFNSYDGTKARYDDSQEVLRQTIGISSESSTVHGVYDDPNFVVKRYQPNELKIATELLGQQELTGVVESSPQPQQIQQRQMQQQPSSSSIANLLDMNTSSDMVRILNPKSMYRKNYMLLDSRYRSATSEYAEPIKEFVWKYINADAQGTGSVNVVGNVRDIIALRVYPFRIPYIEAADNKYKRVSVLIGGFEAQSFRAHERRRFHFFLESVIDSDFINLETNKYNDGFYHFEKPVTNPDNLTVTFGSPLEPITFDTDRDKCTFDYFGIAPLTQITTNSPHNLANGDRVYFSTFDVGAVNPALVQQVIINNTIKETINRESGFLITIIDATNFSIAYDSSNIMNPIANLPVCVYYGSKRVFMPVEITYIMPETTNFE